MRVLTLILLLIITNVSYAQDLDSKILKWALQKDDENKKLKEIIVHYSDTIVPLKDNKIVELYSIIMK
jgi:hypothetical protein